MRDDLLVALRRLARKPGSAVPIALLLTIAIVSVGCVFAVAYGLLAKPLPYPSQDRLSQLTLRSVRMGMDLGWSEPYLAAVAKQSRHIETIAGYRQKEVALFDEGGRYTGTGEAMIAEPKLLPMIGAHVESGRLLVADDAREGAEPVALIARELSNRQFGGPDAALGKKLRAEGKTYRIVGVLAPGPGFPASDIGVWLPMEFSQAQLALSNAGSFGNLRAIALLKQGSEFETASAEMMQLVRSDTTLKAIADEIEMEASARPLRYLWVDDREASLKLILAAALMVFLVTIANACSLFMLRMLARRQEHALLEAVGASRARRISQTVCEAAVLSLIAAIAGAALTPLGIALLAYFDVLPAQVPLSVGFDPALAGAMAGMWAIAVVALSFSGLAFKSSSVYEVLRQTGNGQTSSRASHRARQALVVSQIVATFVLLFGTMLLMRSSHRLLEQDVGFDRSSRLVGTIQSKVGGAGVSTDVLRSQIAALVGDIQSLPGVQAVALSTSAPFSNTVAVEAFRPRNDNGGKETLPNAYVSYVSWDYPKALGLAMIRGRAFERTDAQGQAPVALIDEDLAERYFGNTDPVGSTIAVNDSAKGELVDATVVGVVGRVRQRTLLGRDEFPSIYLPESVPYQVHGMPTDSVELVIKADSAAIEELVRGRMDMIAPDLRFGQLIAMEQRISDTIVDQIRLNRLLQILGGVTLLLTLAGLYALLSHSVLMRLREFGVRLALGATARDLVGSVFRQSGRLVVVALVLAVPLALLLGAGLRDRLFEVSPFDPVSLICVTAFLVVVQCLATVLPAYRSSRVEPMVALRSE